jgi:sodium/hydrogen exchanger 3
MTFCSASRQVLLSLLILLTCPLEGRCQTIPSEDDPLHNLDSVARNVVLLISLLALTLIINNFLQKRGVPIPEAICTVVIGMIAGGVLKVSPLSKGDSIEKLENASATEFMVLFIAPIIFAEGYGLKSREFFDNIARILIHAFLGTLVSALVVGVGMYYLPPLTGFSVKLSLAECLAFGSLISSTDPVTTLAIFKEQQLVENGLSYLYYTVLGESILNDAVGLTLFTAFGDFIVKDQELTAHSILSIGATFLVTFFGSLGIGVVAAILTALILKFARLGSGASEEEHFSFNVPELGVCLVLSYLPFLIAEACNLSGIVAVMFCGITMRHYAHYNMTQVTRQVFLPTIELIANMSETYVFLLLGIGVFLLNDSYSASFILWAALFCLVGRALHVYPFAWVMNKCSNAPNLSFNEQHVCWYAGLRGAVAFMCALTFPLSEKSPQFSHRGYILCTTVILVLSSMVLLGWPTAAVLRCLRIQAREDARPAPPEDTESERLHWRVANDMSEKLMRMLMTSDAIVQREAKQQMASALRSQRDSGAFFGRNSPRSSAGTIGMAGRLMPQVSLGGVSTALPEHARASEPYNLGLPLSSAFGRPSAPARLQVLAGSAASNGQRRSSRMICDP